MTDCEQKYSAAEKATTSLLFACVKFRHYLLTSQHPVLVQSEIDELKRVIQQTQPTERAARFLAALQQYDLVLKVMIPKGHPMPCCCWSLGLPQSQPKVRFAIRRSVLSSQGLKTNLTTVTKPFQTTSRIWSSLLTRMPSIERTSAGAPFCSL